MSPWYCYHTLSTAYERGIRESPAKRRAGKKAQCQRVVNDDSQGKRGGRAAPGLGASDRVRVVRSGRHTLARQGKAEGGQGKMVEKQKRAPRPLRTITISDLLWGFFSFLLQADERRSVQPTPPSPDPPCRFPRQIHACFGSCGYVTLASTNTVVIFARPSIHTRQVTY